MPRLLAESACKDDEFAVKDTNSLQDNDARHRAAAKATDRAPQFGGARLLLTATCVSSLSLARRLAPTLTPRWPKQL